MGQQGTSARVDIKNDNQSGNFQEVTELFDVNLDNAPQLQEDTRFGDSAPRQQDGLIDSSIDLTLRQDYGTNESTAKSELRSAFLNGTELDIEYSPDGQINPSSGAPVFTFAGRISSHNPSASTGDAQEVAITLEVADGTAVSTQSAFTSP